MAIGLLTGNVREGAMRKLAHYGLATHFAFGGYGDLHHERDDVAREALAASHTHLGVAVGGDRVWVIGDTPLDVRCARAIGAKVIAVATGAHTVEELQGHAPDVTVEDLTATAALLKQLSGES
ncbi:MAG TPA: HAD hydrolase-like protein [Pirellulaceae bacterium]|nr:HAD hydrolase-like protein [Pirellulaceae bacterium]